MNKSLFTNLLSFLLLIAGYLLKNDIILYVGLFAFSGAITNWLAVHMLFEKVPGLYGSGVIPARFEEFKLAIKQLMMEQFFTANNIDRFLSKGMDDSSAIDLEPIINKIDFNPSFNTLVDVVANSSFGGMLEMFGGTEALLPLQQPFVEKMQASMVEISQSETVKQAIKDQFITPKSMDDITAKIENIIDQRLNELTPKLVKEIVQKMIKQHLGWLVVWGGIFGGVIGLVSSMLV